jgi:hypothetical protein
LSRELDKKVGGKRKKRASKSERVYWFKEFSRTLWKEGEEHAVSEIFLTGRKKKTIRILSDRTAVLPPAGRHGHLERAPAGY